MESQQLQAGMLQYIPMNGLGSPRTKRKLISAIAMAGIFGSGILGCRTLLGKDDEGLPEINTSQGVETEGTEKIGEYEYIKPFLINDAIIRGVVMPPEAHYQAISVEEAIFFALQDLEERGVKEIKICETHWFTAPFGGFLIDGKGDFSVGEIHYTTFRIGVYDGSQGHAGDIFAFIARGKDDEGNIIWYPEPGPDFRPAEGEVFPAELLVYEFLGSGFESLESRFK
jgi:hypothetical protein